MEFFNVGDVVFFKSGGSPMTVHGTEVQQNGALEPFCVVVLIWHDSAGGLQTAKVHPSTLKLNA